MKAIGSSLKKGTLFLTKPLNTKLFRFIYQLIIYKLRFILLADLLLISTSYQSEESSIEQIATEQFLPVFRSNLSRSLADVNDSTNIRINKYCLENSVLIKTFYTLNMHNPVWTVNNDLTAKSFEFIDLLEGSNYYGLNPDDYNIRLINKLRKELKDSKISDRKIQLRQAFELAMTDAGFKFMIHLNKGLDYSDTLSANKEYINSLPGYFIQSLHTNSLSENILDLQPDNIEYVRLQKALEKYLDLVSINDVKIKIPDPAKEPEQSRINAAKVLVNHGYLAEAHSETDSLYEIALKKFQVLHGLNPDGKLNKKTRKALLKSTRDRYSQIALNLNRLRKDNELGEHFVSVNIPGYKLKIVKKNKIQKEFNVIVGKPWTPTPLISSRIEKIIANPYWNVPKSITLNEILPKLKRDSTYMQRKNFKLLDKKLNFVDYNDVDWENVSAKDFDYYIRQDMSKTNALGVIKFVFPNPYRIYMHDTPTKKLFSKNERAYSHGCIRLENPDIFAEYLVSETYNDNDDIRIKSLLDKGVRKEIELSHPLNIHIRYLTCEADVQNNIYFYNDIYKKDNKQIEMLFN